MNHEGGNHDGRTQDERRDDLLPELNLLLGLGEALLRCGAGSVDVEASLLACGQALQLGDVEVSVTYTEVQLALARTRGDRLVTGMRLVRTRSPNYRRLTALHRLMLDLAEGRNDLRTARNRLDALAAGGRIYPRSVLTLAAGLLGTAVAAQLGGGILLCSITFGISVLLDVLGRAITARNLSGFYVNLAGGALVASTAAVLVAIEAPLRPPLVIAAGVVVLLPGITLITSVQDALSGFMVTAAGRAVEVMVLGGGIVAGVASVMVIADAAGLVMPVFTPLELRLAGLPWRFVTAGMVASTVAIGMQAPPVTVPTIFLLGGTGYVTFLSLDSLLDSPSLARAAAAASVGFLGQIYAHRRTYPALILAVPLITPMLPGLAVYSALLELTQGDRGVGAATLLAAGTGATALALGIVLGEFLAQPAARRPDRPARPYSGPRLLGPVS